MYRNVLGREFDQAGYDYWLDLLQGSNDGGGNPELKLIGRGEAVRWITGSAEFESAYPYLPE